MIFYLSDGYKYIQLLLLRKWCTSITCTYYSMLEDFLSEIATIVLVVEMCVCLFHVRSVWISLEVLYHLYCYQSCRFRFHFNPFFLCGFAEVKWSHSFLAESSYRHVYNIPPSIRDHSLLFSSPPQTQCGAVYTFPFRLFFYYSWLCSKNIDLEEPFIAIRDTQNY